MSIRKYLAILATACFLVLSLCAYINYTIDPAEVFSEGKSERQMASYLLNGKNVAGLNNFDERLLQKYYIEGAPGKRDIVVFGSSRSMYIRSTMFPGLNFHNNAVSSATLGDYLALTELYYSKGSLPSVIILGVDHWALFSYDLGLGSLKNEYLTMLSRLGVKPETKMALSLRTEYLKYKELVSLSYLEASIKMWLASDVRNRKGYPVDEDIPDNTGLLKKDGSWIFNKDYREFTPAEVRLKAIEYTSKLLGSGPDRITPQTKIVFENYIDFLLHNNVKIVFFLPPFHPITYKNMMNMPEYKIVTTAQKYLLDVAARKKIQVVGSYNPEECGLGESDFFDGHHLNEAGCQKVVTKLKF